MRVVVADTGPLHYLVLTGDINLLPRLFAQVLIPERVREELAQANAPNAVRSWIGGAPPWLQVSAVDHATDASDLQKLDAGERDAIALATATKADLLLIDERDGVAVARRRGFVVTGTLGFLDLAARQGLVDLPSAFERLEATSFYYSRGLLDALLARHRDTS